MNILLSFFLLISVLAFCCDCMDKKGKGKAAKNDKSAQSSTEDSISEGHEGISATPNKPSLMKKLGKAFRKTLPNSFQSAIKKATNKGKEKVGEITKNAENSQTSAEDGATDGQYLAAAFGKNHGIKKATNSVEIQNAQPSTAEEPAKDAKNAENSQSPAENGATADGQSLATFENNENLKNEICSICLDEDNLLSTDPKNSEVKELNKCHHRFHRECVDGWLITNQTCPTCRGVEAGSNDLPATAAAAGRRVTNAGRIIDANATERRFTGEGEGNYTIVHNDGSTLTLPVHGNNCSFKKRASIGLAGWNGLMGNNFTFTNTGDGFIITRNDRK